MFTAVPDPDGRTLIVEGEVDLAEADRLVTAAIELTDGDVVRLDMRGVTFLDSTGIRALLRIPATTGRELELISPHRRVRRVLELVGLEIDLSLRIVEEPSRPAPPEEPG